MGLFKGFFSGLTQLATDDVNGLISVLIFCLIDEDNYSNYRKWFVTQVLGNRTLKHEAVGQGVFNDLTQQAANKERRGMKAALDQILWQIRQGELAI